ETGKLCTRHTPGQKHPGLHHLCAVPTGGCRFTVLRRNFHLAASYNEVHGSAAGDSNWRYKLTDCYRCCTCNNETIGSTGKPKRIQRLPKTHVRSEEHTT